MPKYLIPLLLACFGISSFMSVGAQEVTMLEKGKVVFQHSCHKCHKANKSIFGPALSGVDARWDNDVNAIKAFIRNPAQMLANKDTRAVKAWELARHRVMTPFPKLSDEELNAVVIYIGSL